MQGREQERELAAAKEEAMQLLGLQEGAGWVAGLLELYSAPAAGQYHPDSEVAMAVLTSGTMGICVQG